MTVVAKPAVMTVDQFLVWAARQPSGRYELANGRAVKMSPERNRHVDAKAECWLAFRKAIADANLPLHASIDGITVVIDDHTAREPDVTVQTLPIDPDALVANEPVVVVEVVSPTSERGDTGAKLAEYFRVASIRHYLIVDPYGMAVVRHSRDGESGSIATTVFELGTIELDPPGLSVRVEDLLRAQPGDAAEKKN